MLNSEKLYMLYFLQSNVGLGLNYINHSHFDVVLNNQYPNIGYLTCIFTTTFIENTEIE